MPMTLAQARKMVKGTLKGNSAMAQAIKEMISGEVALDTTGGAVSAPPASSGVRGDATIARFKAQEDGW